VIDEFEAGDLEVELARERRPFGSSPAHFMLPETRRRMLLGRSFVHRLHAGVDVVVEARRSTRRVGWRSFMRALLEEEL